MIGIFGGTFDPVHNAHLRVAEHLLHAMQLSEIRFVPCNIPVHRDQPGASPAERVTMLQLATKHEKRFVVDDCEIQRQGRSYMIETLEHFHQTLSEPLSLIMGYDAWNHFDHWHRWEDILTLANIIILNRPGHEIILTRPLQTFKDRIHIIEETYFDISATRIREALAQHHATELQQLLPRPVLTYIQEKDLYQ